MYTAKFNLIVFFLNVTQNIELFGISAKYFYFLCLI